MSISLYSLESYLKIGHNSSVNVIDHSLLLLH